jgi:hypothetical protein
VIIKRRNKKNRINLECIEDGVDMDIGIIDEYKEILGAEDCQVDHSVGQAESEDHSGC